ncbi:hypothetical protein P9112_003879 [Eukaryota sp. TZLM1-RC]
MFKSIDTIVSSVCSLLKSQGIDVDIDPSVPLFVSFLSLSEHIPHDVSFQLQWVQFASFIFDDQPSELSNIQKHHLGLLAPTLTNQTFLAVESPGIADVVLFFAIRPFLGETATSAAETGLPKSILRWINDVQHVISHDYIELDIYIEPEKKQKKKQKMPQMQTKKKEKVKKAPQPQEPTFVVALTVGKVVDCSSHPDSDKLLIETIDFGNEDVRPIVSGIAHHVVPSDLIGKKVLCVTNLRPAMLAGKPSKGMLLCVDSRPLYLPDHVQEGTRAGPRGVTWQPKKQIKSKDWAETKLEVVGFKCVCNGVELIFESGEGIESIVESGDIQ